MYLASVIISLCASYFILQQLFSLFFAGKLAKIRVRSIRSVGIIFLLTIIGYAVALYLPDLELGNRILHGFVGGFVTFMVCFLAVKDDGLEITKFQFLVMSILIVTSLGVLNEHIEYFLQEYVRVLFYSNPRDTWLDLISNSVGIAIGSAIFVPFINRKKLPHNGTDLHIVEGGDN